MKYFWIDMEMTGLDVSCNHILEIAVIITNEQLEPIEHYSTAVHCPDSMLTQMDEWNKRTHVGSGLWLASRRGKYIREAEIDLLELCERHFRDLNVILCGSSLHLDRQYIEKFMPNFAKKLHYRVIDISSFKAIFQWTLGIPYKRGEGHRALDDIKDSINELKSYLALLDRNKVPNLHSLNLKPSQ